MKSKTIKVKVISKVYTINIVDSDYSALDKQWGVVYYNDKTIYIRDDLTKETTKECIAHELTHAYWYEIGNRQVVPTVEYMCDFVSVWAELIVKQTNEIMKKYEKNK